MRALFSASRGNARARRVHAPIPGAASIRCIASPGALGDPEPCCARSWQSSKSHWSWEWGAGIAHSHARSNRRRKQPPVRGATRSRARQAVAAAVCSPINLACAAKSRIGPPCWRFLWSGQRALFVTALRWAWFRSKSCLCGSPWAERRQDSPPSSESLCSGLSWPLAQKLGRGLCPGSDFAGLSVEGMSSQMRSSRPWLFFSLSAPQADQVEQAGLHGRSGGFGLLHGKEVAAVQHADPALGDALAEVHAHLPHLQ